MCYPQAAAIHKASGSDGVGNRKPCAELLNLHLLNSQGPTAVKTSYITLKNMDKSHNPKTTYSSYLYNQVLEEVKAYCMLLQPLI